MVVQLHGQPVQIGRDRNEDSVRCFAGQDRGVFVVADGLGVHGKGEARVGGQTFAATDRLETVRRVGAPPCTPYSRRAVTQRLHGYRYIRPSAAFFVEEDIGEVSNDGIPLMRELEHQLQTFGSHLQPYAKERGIDADLFFGPETQSVNCAACFAFHVTGSGMEVMTERYIFSSLYDFLFVELGKAILHSNAPRQCQLCGRWFLHEQGDRAMYCEHIAPGEESKTCREAGARAIFEKKIQDEDTWKIYKRAYKKYYACVMKGNTSREDFNAWVVQATVASVTIFPTVLHDGQAAYSSRAGVPAGRYGKGVSVLCLYRELLIV